MLDGSNAGIGTADCAASGAASSRARTGTSMRCIDIGSGGRDDEICRRAPSLRESWRRVESGEWWVMDDNGGGHSTPRPATRYPVFFLLTPHSTALRSGASC